ncbi:MAG: hypothetical protein DWQ08_06790 [Proteobacteria bacterium]|nr:MAG: hypothetical protein DWQ08_06790 [Pseudomonadota bacterium]
MTPGARGPVACVLAVAAAPAFAHATVEGIGNFYNGLLHPFVVLPHALALIALGLLLGQQGVGHARRALPAFGLAAAVSLLVSAWVSGLPLGVAILSAGTVAGLLVAAATPLPRFLTLGLATATAIFIGLDSNPDGLGGVARLTLLSGVWLGTGFAVLGCFGIAETLRRGWQRIGIRIAGSWIAAVSIMVVSVDAGR